MDNKDWIEVIKIALLVPTAIFAIARWLRGEKWKRVAQFDGLVKEFESNYRLRLAAIAVDWTSRSLPAASDEPAISFDSQDVLVALDAEIVKLDPTQVRLRDAFDSLLAYFGRLQRVIESGLVDDAWARQSFCYWLERFLSMDRHSGKLRGSRSPQQLVGDYIVRYGDRRAFCWFCEKWDIQAAEARAILNRESRLVPINVKVSAASDNA
jgi:hypothetical protein